MMKKGDFWKELERRVEENRKLGSGLPKFLAPIVNEWGLEFWKVGLVVSGLMALGCWFINKELVILMGRWSLGI